MTLKSLLKRGALTNIAAFNFENIAKHAGFAFETHKVVTKDGYILTLHRLPPKQRTSQYTGIPLLLQHGLWSSSEDWIWPGPTKSIGFLLSEAGFDVWLGNTRGNIYSREHEVFSPCDDAKHYWDFTWHEMGCFDLPAMIQFVCDFTQRDYLYYIGHSQGTTAFFVMGSCNPENCRQVKAMFALAPVAYLRHMKNKHFLNLAEYYWPIYKALLAARCYKIVPTEKMLKIVDGLWPVDDMEFSEKILRNLAFHACPEVKDRLKIILMSHFLCGTSFKVLAHFAQCTQPEKKFSRFDYGPKVNEEFYGSPEAPIYNLKTIPVPMVLFHSDTDWLTQPEDMNALKEDLPKRFLSEQITELKFNHLDFLWADFKKYHLYEKLLQHITIFEQS